MQTFQLNHYNFLLNAFRDDSKGTGSEDLTWDLTIKSQQQNVLHAVNKKLNEIHITDLKQDDLKLDKDQIVLNDINKIESKSSTQQNGDNKLQSTLDQIKSPANQNRNSLLDKQVSEKNKTPMVI